MDEIYQPKWVAARDNQYVGEEDNFNPADVADEVNELFRELTRTHNFGSEWAWKFIVSYYHGARNG